MSKHKTITKVVRENRKRSPEYWEGYKDALQVMGECGPVDFTGCAWTYLKQLIADAKGRLEGCLRVREASKKSYEKISSFDGLNY